MCFKGGGYLLVKYPLKKYDAHSLIKVFCMEKAHSNIVVVGGGIAGLWLYRRLRDEGKQAVLIEKDALGKGQTISSQAMVHGGQRYALQGHDTKHARNIANMPGIWEDCLEGTGEIDLSKAEKASETQVMWSPGTLASKVTAFFASKTMRARVNAIKPNLYPAALQSDAFKGNVYQMDECVLEMHSVLKALVGAYTDGVYQGTITKFNREEDGFSSVVVEQDGKEIELSADHFVFTAAQGNELALEALGIKPEDESQRRPLHQIMVKGDLPEIQGHCLAADYEPRMTITTHHTKEGETVWYLGGRVSTRTTELSAAENIAQAKAELEDVFPWIDWQSKQWSTLLIDRAEPKYVMGLGDGPVVKTYGNVKICWPTKLTFAPGLSEVVMEELAEEMKEGVVVNLPLPHPDIATYPWDETQWQTV